MRVQYVAVCAREVFALRQLLLVLAVALVVSPSVSGAGDPLLADREPVEVVGLRSASSETFEKADGTFTTRVYARPIHFRDGRGGWQKIDTSFNQGKRPGFAFSSGANAFRIDVKNAVSGVDRGSGGFLRFVKDDVDVGMSLEGARQAAGEREGAHAIRFRNVLGDVDLEYSLLPDGVKETLVLQSADAPSSFRFVLAPAVLLQEMWQGWFLSGSRS